MDNIRFPRSFKVYLPLILLFVLLFLLMPRVSRFNYDYKKGSTWMYETLVSQFEFPVLKTETQMQEEREKAGMNVIPYYKVDASVRNASHIMLSEMDMGECSYAKKDISAALDVIYDKGVVSEIDDAVAGGIVYVQKDRRAARIPISEIYTQLGADLSLKKVVSQVCRGYDIDSLYKTVGLASLISPNLIFDQRTTDMVHAEGLVYISPTQGVIPVGQVIVSNGEIVTAEVEQLLDSYKAEYDSNYGYEGPDIAQWIGDALIALFLVFVLFISIYFCNPKIFVEYNKYLYLLMIFALSAVVSFLMERFSPDLSSLFPYPLFALYLLAFFTKRTVFTVYIISLLPMLIFSQDGMELFVMYLVSGLVAILAFQKFHRGWHQFITAFIIFVSMLMVFASFRLLDDLDGFRNYNAIIYLFINALLTVAGYPFIYLFERMYYLVSNTKLVELSDTSNKLLRMLADKAPGTFQHSLQVMNLADEVARSVHANVPLIRAAALYHDIGKIQNPQCFTENQTPGVNYHEGLTLKESSHDIIKHVSDGLALADKFGLPHILKDFISTHHGTTTTGYFYTKYVNEGGDPADIDAFTYNGQKPVTKEQVILMICDSLEAASRSLKDYSPESISELVERITDGKIHDGQLYNADISLKEINTIKEVMKSYLQRMYHSRIAYPKRTR